MRISFLWNHTSYVFRILYFFPMPWNRVEYMKIIERTITHASKNIQSGLDLHDSWRVSLLRHPACLIKFDWVKHFKLTLFCLNLIFLWNVLSSKLIDKILSKTNHLDFFSWLIKLRISDWIWDFYDRHLLNILSSLICNRKWSQQFLFLICFHLLCKFRSNYFVLIEDFFCLLSTFINVWNLMELNCWFDSFKRRSSTFLLVFSFLNSCWLIHSFDSRWNSTENYFWRIQICSFKISQHFMFIKLKINLRISTRKNWNWSESNQSFINHLFINRWLL